MCKKIHVQPDPSKTYRSFSRTVLVYQSSGSRTTANWPLQLNCGKKYGRENMPSVWFLNLCIRYTDQHCVSIRQRLCRDQINLTKVQVAHSNFYEKSSHIRVNQLSYVSKPTDKWEQYDWRGEKNWAGIREGFCRVRVFFFDPVVLESICYCTTANRLKHKGNTTG